jgi:hypothetical protein
MLSRALRLLVLVASAGLSSAGAGPAWAQDDELEAMATALKDTTFTLQDGLKAGEREGQPISAQFEIDDGKLQISGMRAPVDQNGPEIVDVGKGRAGDQQVAEPGAIRTASSGRPPGAVIAPSSTRLTTSSRYGTRSRTIVPEDCSA